MSKKEIPLREARAQLGPLAERAHHGETFIITKNGRPYARLTPLETAMNTYTYAIEISDDGEIWMPESDAAVATMASSDTVQDFARDILWTWMDDLPEESKGGHRRIVVWKGEQQDTVDIAACVLTAHEMAAPLCTVCGTAPGETGETLHPWSDDPETGASRWLCDTCQDRYASA